MGFFDFLSPQSVKVTANDIKQGSLVDVRSAGEFASGHHPDSINIPLQEVEKQLDKIKSLKSPVYLCCASGGRSQSAENFLKAHQVDAINLGGWKSVPQ